MKKALLIFCLAAFIATPLISLAAGADGLVPCGNPDQSPCQFCDFFVMFDNILKFFLIKIVPVLAALIIAIGGFIYIVSRADPGMLELSRRIFTSVVYGLLIIYGAWLFVNLFFQLIGVAKWTGLSKGWWQINCP